MKTLPPSDIQEFDILLYESWGGLFMHCAWFTGHHWGIPTNFESLRGGPEFQEWAPGKLPKYVVRRALSHRQKMIIRLTCAELAPLKYDYRSFFRAVITLGHWLEYGDNKQIRCDELIKIGLERSGIPVPEVHRPEDFMDLPHRQFDVYEVVE